MKKFISIFLVGIMVVCVFAIPASASEIEPYYAVTVCPQCGGSARMGEEKLHSIQYNILVTSCPYFDFIHFHDLYIYTVDVVCSNCGNYTLTYSQSVCP
ncbi:MAG: hypothetical protein ACI4EX_06670 [Lachnospiraceae bacterium]